MSLERSRIEDDCDAAVQQKRRDQQTPKTDDTAAASAQATRNPRVRPGHYRN
jgi:hypothetical protein